MENEKLKKLLRELPGRSIEKARPGFAEEIKNQIPHRLIHHRLDTINIIVDFRINKLTAAAVVLAVIVLLGGFFGLRGSPAGEFVRDGKLFLKYCLRGENAYKADMLEGLSKLHESLVQQGREVVYYGAPADRTGRYVVLMHWKLPDGRYGVIFGDMTARTVSSDTLIRLQNSMLSENAK
jgi:hypothetical protein